MKTPQTTRTKKGTPETVCTSAPPGSNATLSSSVTALVIEQILAKLGVHATLSDLVGGAQLFETAIMQSRWGGKPEPLC